MLLGQTLEGKHFTRPAVTALNHSLSTDLVLRLSSPGHFPVYSGSTPWELDLEQNNISPWPARLFRNPRHRAWQPLPDHQAPAALSPGAGTPRSWAGPPARSQPLCSDSLRRMRGCPQRGQRRSSHSALTSLRQVGKKTWNKNPLLIKIYIICYVVYVVLFLFL